MRIWMVRMDVGEMVYDTVSCREADMLEAETRTAVLWLDNSLDLSESSLHTFWLTRIWW